MSPVTLVFFIVLLAILAYMFWRYYAFKKSVTQIDNETFKAMMRHSQIIDLRDPASFQRKHILGARNFSERQFAVALSALRKDKPILLYEGSRPTFAPKAARQLKAAGYTDLYFLKTGFDAWDGKVK
ncbi:MAG: rhodanese-like domain-containing protein [Streptococcus pyogenes]|uniref:rhodanese-like domain-containing protein n=1 Tax=Streptococcus halichoeri TaxID=254785 RepID=UPI000DB25EBF|nr:rhodanese-like domain-containing protein [Streptococcus halichoeri]PZO94751.1 MAG: rhodanese-like domain-containing protein [Streptococcus pyogenes]